MWEKVNTNEHLLAIQLTTGPLIDSPSFRASLIFVNLHFVSLSSIHFACSTFSLNCKLKINIDSFVRLQVSRSNWSCAKWSHWNELFFFLLLSTFSNCHTLVFSFACCLIFTWTTKKKYYDFEPKMKKKKITRLTALAPIKFNENKSILLSCCCGLLYTMSAFVLIAIDLKVIWRRRRRRCRRR